MPGGHKGHVCSAPPPPPIKTRVSLVDIGFPPSAAEKWKFPQPIFLYIVTIHNDQISNVEHVSGPLYLFFTLSGCLEGGEGASE